MREFFKDAEAIKGRLRTVSRMDDRDNNLQQGHNQAPGVEIIAETNNKTEVVVPEKISDVERITKTERGQEVKEMETTTITNTQTKQGRYATIGRSGNSKEEVAAEKKARSEVKKRGRDLHGGLEILNLDFLLDIVENTDGTDEYDMTMRKLGFHELARTGRLSDIDSNALGYVCMDEDGLFDKRMQCEAMQELAARTEQSLGN